MGNQPETPTRSSSPSIYRKDSTTILKGKPSSAPSLQSRIGRRSKNHIWRRWKFCSQRAAETKYNELQSKMKDKQYGQVFFKLADVQFVNFNTNQMQSIYRVNAKIQYPARTLKEDLDERKMVFKGYTEKQLWKILRGLCRLGTFSTGAVPKNLSEIYIGCEGELKIKDPSLFTEIKVTVKKNKIQKSKDESLKNILKHMVSLSLLEHQQIVSFQSLNRINLKYNTTYSALLHKIYQSQITLAQLVDMVSNQQSTLQNNGILFKTSLCFNKVSACSTIGNETMILKSGLQMNYQSQPVLPMAVSSQFRCNKEKDQSSEYTRIQPKMMSNENNQELTVGQKGFEKQNENKQNQNILNQCSSNKTSLKTSLDIEDHCFPKAVKMFKKSNSLPLTEDPLENTCPHPIKQCELSDEFRKGEEEELLNQSNQSLLESIIESEDSIMMKINNRQSPMMDIDEEIEAITKDFQKLQQQFMENEQKQKLSSILEFHPYHRNSTIMEVTEESQDQSQHEPTLTEGAHTSLSSQSATITHSIEGQDKFIIEEYEGGSRYEGYTLNGLRHGFGKLFYEDGGSYEGNWKEGEIDGFGKLFYQSGNMAYEGEWTKGEFDGEGKIMNQSPDELDGPYDYHDFSQIGTAWLWYEGQFEKDHKHGKGILMLENGQKLEGHWEMNNVDGQCTFYRSKLQPIKGVWKNNILEEQFNA